jgi:hypothetical protein
MNDSAGSIPETLKPLNRLASVYVTADHMTEAIRLFNGVLTPTFTRQNEPAACPRRNARALLPVERGSDLRHALEFIPRMIRSDGCCIDPREQSETYHELCRKSVERLGHLQALLREAKALIVGQIPSAGDSSQ